MSFPLVRHADLNAPSMTRYPQLCRLPGGMNGKLLMVKITAQLQILSMSVCQDLNIIFKLTAHDFDIGKKMHPRNSVNELPIIQYSVYSLYKGAVTD